VRIGPAKGGRWASSDYIYPIDINIPGGLMALQIANPTVVDKVEPLERLAALLSQLDRIPDRPDAADPLPWDEQGLPV
jgi:antitoxin VapB